MLSPRLIFSRRKIKLLPPDLGLPEVNVLGRYNIAKANPPLAAHQHRGAFEFCYLQKGSQTLSMQHRTFKLTGGDFCIMLPDEWHGSGGTPEEKAVMYWLILQIPRRPGCLFTLSPAETAILRSSLTALAHQRIKAVKEIKPILDELIIAALDQETPFRRVLLQAKILEFLFQVLRSGRQNPAAANSDDITALLQYVESRLDQPLPVKELADSAGLSVVGLKTKFKKIMGIPPAEYVLRRKIEKSKEQLRNNAESVTGVALDLGFSSSQYFATVFKRYTGMKPRDWRSRG